MNLVLWLMALSLLLGQPLPTTAAQDPVAATAAQELAAITAEVQDNTKDLRRNITHWQKIATDGNLTEAEKKHWRQKAEAYLQECLTYSLLLNQVDLKKIAATAPVQDFLQARKTFQRELLFFQEILEKKR